MVIDHGCGLRRRLSYGLQVALGEQGQTVERGQAVGVLGEELTMDFKLGSKSVNPWLLFQTSGGLFWKERADSAWLGEFFEKTCNVFPLCALLG